MKRRSRLFTTLLALLGTAALAQPPEAMVSRFLVTGREDQHSPTISPDGRWLVYAEEGAGLTRLMGLQLTGSERGRTRHLYPHPAATEQPVFSPRGNQLAFVSRRDDALGDVYIAAFPSGTPRRVSDRGRLDFRPRFTPDGETLIYLSRAPGERFGLEAWSIADRRRVPPPSESHPPTPYPVAWAIPGTPTALLYADDLNGDGEFGEGDPASAFEFRDGEWIRVSPPIPDARGITMNPSTGRIIVSGRFYDAVDIAVLRDEPLRTLRSTTEFLEEARRQQQRWGIESELALVCLQRAVQASATQQERDESTLAYARTLNRVGRHAQAVRFIEQQLPVVSDGVWRLRLSAQLVEARHFISEIETARNPFAARPAEDTEGRLRQLAAEFERLGLPDDRADALLTLARHHRAMGNPAAALREIESILAIADTDGDVQTRALLLRAAIHTELGLGLETRQSLLRVLGLDAASPSARDEAAGLLVRQVLETAASGGESPVLALRALRAEHEHLEWLQARILNEEGRLLADSGEMNAAARVLLESIAIAAAAPSPAVDAARQLVTILTPSRQLHRAVPALQQLSIKLNESMPDTPVARAARDLYMATAIEQGGNELALGDPALAASTFRALLNDEPGNLDAMRGLMEASAALPGRITEEIRIARELTRSQPRSAEAWYRHALAVSYPDAAGGTAMRSVDRAISLDPTRAQFHLLKGFLFEQRFDEAQRRGRPPLALIESAANAYEQGMSLVDRRANPRLYADFVLNSANAALALQQNFKARDLYREREQLGIPIEPLQRGFLFHLRAGIAHFQASDPLEAIRHFTEAETLLERLGSIKDARALRYQLLGRRGLALMDLQRHGEAARIFERSLALAPPRSLSRVRTMRNIAFLQEREAARSTGSDRVERLLTAQRVARQALDELDQPGLQPDADFRRSGGLIDMDIVITTDVSGGGARLSIDIDDERRILHALLAGISAQLSDRTTALVQWNTQLALDPRIDDSNRAYYGALRAVTLSRVAGESIRVGDGGRAIASLEEALALTRFELAGVKVLNGPAAVTLLLQTTEALLSTEETLPRRRNAWWMVEDLRQLEGASDWALLDEAAARLLAMPDPLVLSGTPLVPEPLDRARLHMVRALAHEQLAREALTLQRSAGVIHGIMAELQAGRVLADAESASDPATARRLGLFAQLLRLRMSLLAGDEKGSDLMLHEARLHARQNGSEHLAWLIDTTAAIHAPDHLGKVRHAVDAMAALLEAPIYTIDGQDVLPDALLSALEGILLQDAERRGDGAIAAWNVVDAFRVIRLRWLAEGSTFRTSDPRGRQWLAERDRLLSIARAASQRLASTPSASAALRRTRQGELERARQQLARHLTSNSAIPIATVVRPESLGYEAIGQLHAIEPRFVLDHVAGGRRWTAVYTKDEQRFVDPSELESLDGRIVLLGESSGTGRSNQLRILTSFDYFESCLRLALRSERGRVIYRTADAPDPNDLAIANSLEIAEPVRVLGGDPSLWIVGASRTSLANLFDQAASLNLIELTLEWPAGISPHEVRRSELALMQYLRSRGVVQARINGVAHMGRVLTPADDEALAMEELAEARGRLLAYFGEGRQRETITALRDVIGIKEALDLQVMPLEQGAELLAVDYFSLANLEMRLGRHAAALEAATRAVRLASETEAAAGFLIDSLLVQGDAAMALFDYPKAEAIYTTVLGQTPGTDVQYDALLRIADAQEADGRYRDAVATAGRARALLGTDDARYWQTELRVARILNRRETRYAEAESIYRRAIGEAGDFPAVTYEAWLGLARVSQALGLFLRAEEELAAAAQLAGEFEAAESRLLSQALVELELAQNHWLRSDYFNAFQTEQQLLRKIDVLEGMTSLTADQRRDREALAIATRNLAGLTAWALNDLRRAHGALDEALRLAEAAALPAEIASTLNNIGLLQRSEARYDEAIASFEKALSTDLRHGNRWGEAYALRNIGITLTLSGRPQDAVQPLTRAVDLAGAIGDRVNRTKALLALGDALRALGQTTQAVAVYTEAESLAGVIPLPEVRWRALHGLARIELEADRKAAALELMTRAVAIVDALRAAIRVQEFQDGFLLDKQDLYDELVRLHLDLGNVAAALESSERSRGRNFIDLLGNTTLRLGRLEDQQAVERERALRSAIEAAERLLGGADPDDRAAIESDLARLRQDYADFLVLLRATDPQLASLVAVAPVNVAELQALLDEGTHLLVYHLLGDELVAWVVTSGTIDVRRMSVSAEELRARLLAAREAIQTFEPLGDELAALSEFVLRPVLPLLGGAPRVCIVPHRELHLLPFAALPSTPGQVLIDEMAVFFVPSASVLRYTVSRRDDRTANQRVLALGDPDLGSAGFELPFARKEADRLRFDFDNVTIRLGADATESWLVANLQEYGIIHIASHGEYDPFAPLLSSLLLAPDANSDGLLTAEEIFGLTLRADLIALSACQTGLGRIGTGDDIVGLNRAFVYAGTRQLLSTLWRVDDISTALLFKHFYRQMRTTDRAEALRQAQLILKARPEYRHPARWAGLVLSGDWQ